MIRTVFIELLLFLLPFALYYLLVVRRRRGERVTWPIVYLSLAGITIAAAAMFWLAAVDGEDPDKHYEPAVDTIKRDLSPDIPAYRQ